TLSNVVVARVVRTGDGKQAEFRRAVEVADRLDALLSSPRQTVSGEGSARSDPPPHAMMSQQSRIVGEEFGQADPLPALDAFRQHEGIEIELVHLLQRREDFLRVMASIEDDRAQAAQSRMIQGTGQMTVTVAVEDDRLLHRRLANEQARRRGHQGSPIRLAP